METNALTNRPASGSDDPFLMERRLPGGHADGHSSFWNRHYYHAMTESKRGLPETLTALDERR
jgi:hypothetical protein